MAPSQSSEDENRLFDTIRDRVDTVTASPEGWGRVVDSIEESTAVLISTAVGMTLLSTPAAAQAQEIGSALCSSGAGWAAAAVGIVAAVYLVGSGSIDLIGAIDDAGSVKDEKKEMARQEARGGLTSIAGGLVGVPFIGALLGQLLPDSFGCIGFELNLLVVAALPF